MPSNGLETLRHSQTLGILAPKQTMPHLLIMVERYIEEMTPTEKGESQERYRAKQFRKSKLADMQLDKT
jgi:hypothetical protein